MQQLHYHKLEQIDNNASKPKYISKSTAVSLCVSMGMTSEVIATNHHAYSSAWIQKRFHFHVQVHYVTHHIT